MPDLLTAARHYLICHQGVTQHTDYQSHCARELHDAIAEVDGTPTRQEKADALEGHTTEGYTPEGIGNAKPKVTIGEAERLLASRFHQGPTIGGTGNVGGSYSGDPASTARERLYGSDDPKDVA
jgi:hypothetical protein